MLGGTVAPTKSAGPAHVTRAVRADVLALAGVALALRLPAYLAARHLYPDDGEYGMSVVAMRAGGLPFRDVFSSQGPLHLPLLYLGDLVGLRTFDAPRVTPVLAGIVATVLTYFVARRLTSRAGALVAALLVATSGSVLWVTGPITADGTTLAFTVGAFLAALRYRERPSVGRAITVALLIAGGVLVKPAIGALAGTAAVVLVVRERRTRDLIAGAAAAVCAALVVSAPFGLDRVWKQTVDYQTSSQREASIHDNVAKVATALWDRDVLLLAMAAVAIAAAFSARALSARASGGITQRSGVPARDTTPVHLLWLWVGVVLAFLIVEPALWRNHISSLVVPLALLVALYLPLRRWLAIVLLVIVPLHVYSLRTILHPGPYDRTTLAAHNALEALPPGAWALSDEVGLVWRSHRRTTDYFVDTSIKRQQQGQITAASIAAAASDPRVCGVLVWSAAYWGSFKNLGTLLAASGYEPKQHFPGQNGVRVLYVKAPCPAPHLRLVASAPRHSAVGRR